MLVEAFRKLAVFGDIESYRYVGFGSAYFSDFILVHKTLGISNMISIERDEANEERFQFNRPFNCIRIEFGSSSDVLPRLRWDVRTILWLDYDGKLDRDTLTDIKYACSSAPPGSMLIVTVNAHPERANGLSPSEIASRRLERLQENIGAEKIPGDVDGKALKGWGEAEVLRRIIENEVLQTLSERNGGRDTGNKIKYRQLFNFHYADGPRMLTTGGLLYDEGHENIVNGGGFNQLKFAVLSDSDPYLIEVPNLTYREIQHLDAQLPVTDHTDLQAKSIPEKDLERYARIYRYFPNFAEADM
jgi:hypothetical protein